jgi:hypothetical protein
MKSKSLRNNLWIGFLGFIIVVITYGCSDLFSSRTLRETEIRSTVLTSYRFDDIPIPSGMTINRRESFIYETGNTRAGLLVYEGKGEISRISNFYKQQMPNYKWKLLSNFEIYNVMLTFIKEGWSSVIYIIPQADDTIRLEIRVGPIEIKMIP